MQTINFLYTFIYAYYTRTDLSFTSLHIHPLLCGSFSRCFGPRQLNVSVEFLGFHPCCVALIFNISFIYMMKFSYLHACVLAVLVTGATRPWSTAPGAALEGAVF